MLGAGEILGEQTLPIDSFRKLLVFFRNHLNDGQTISAFQ